MADSSSKPLEEALGGLASALEAVVRASRRDDKSPLENAIALRQTGEQWCGDINNIRFLVIHGDLNGFKKLNDQHGHHTGDAALHAVGERLREAKKLSSDGAGICAFREHGDEFWVLCRANCETQLLEFIGQEFKALRVPFEGRTHTVRMSFGVAKADGQTSFDELMRRADMACKVAKSKGAGAVEIWEENTEKEVPEVERTRCECGMSIAVEIMRTQRKGALIKVCPHCSRQLDQQSSSSGK